MWTLIFLSTVVPTIVSQECARNAHFVECSNVCPLTCDNYDDPLKSCHKRCFQRCQCDEGYVKRSDGRCVKPRDCNAVPRTCGKNAYFTNCLNPCPTTCENHHDPPRVCSGPCQWGCECEDEYVKSFDGRCVKPQECPNHAGLCGRNAHFEICRYKCLSLTCKNYMEPLDKRLCVDDCDMGCQCDRGYVRNSNGLCVSPQECTPRSSGRPEICRLLPNRGPCSGNFIRYGYNVRTGRCQKFIYSGCGWNHNNFRTLDECIKTCV